MLNYCSDVNLRCYLIELTFFNVNFGFRRRHLLRRLEREARQSELRSRDRVQYTETAPSYKYVDESVLEQRGKHEHKTHRHPDVDCLDVGHSRHRRVNTRRLRRCRKHSQQADGYACRTRLDINPERDPWQNDDEQTWQVDLDDEVADVASEYEPYFKARKRPWFKAQTLIRSSS